MQTYDDLIIYMLVTFDENTFYIMRQVQHKGHSVILKEFILYNSRIIMSILNWLHSFGAVEKAQTKESIDLKDLSFRYLGLYFTATWCSYCVKLANKMP